MSVKLFNRKLIIVFLLVAIVLSLLSIIIGLTATNNTGYKSTAKNSQEQSGVPYGSLGFVIEESNAENSLRGSNGAR